MHFLRFASNAFVSAYPFTQVMVVLMLLIHVDSYPCLSCKETCRLLDPLQPLPGMSRLEELNKLPKGET